MTNEDNEFLDFDEDNGLGRILKILSVNAHDYYTQCQVSKRISIAEKGTPLEQPFMELAKIFDDVEKGIRRAYDKFYEIENIKEGLRNAAFKTSKPKVNTSHRREAKQDMAERKTVRARAEHKRNKADSAAAQSKRAKSIAPVLARIGKRK